MIVNSSQVLPAFEVTHPDVEPRAERLDAQVLISLIGNALQHHDVDRGIMAEGSRIVQRQEYPVHCFHIVLLELDSPRASAACAGVFAKLLSLCKTGVEKNPEVVGLLSETDGVDEEILGRRVWSGYDENDVALRINHDRFRVDRTRDGILSLSFSRHFVGERRLVGVKLVLVLVLSGFVICTFPCFGLSEAEFGRATIQ